MTHDATVDAFAVESQNAVKCTLHPPCATNPRTKLALSPTTAEGKAARVRVQLDIERIMSAGEGAGSGMM